MKWIFFRKKYHHQTCSTFNGFVNTLCHLSLLPAVSLYVSSFRRAFEDIFAGYRFLLLFFFFDLSPVWVGASSFQSPRSTVLCFSYHLKTNISFFVCHKRVGKFLICRHMCLRSVGSGTRVVVSTTQSDESLATERPRIGVVTCR